MAEGEEERPSGGGDESDDENGRYPIGFRFKPTTEEVVEFYLLPKLLGEPSVPNEFVIEANAYEFDPEILTAKYKERSVDDTWYFLSPRYRRYPGGDRPVRRTEDERGRWKPSTGQSKPPEGEDGAPTKPRKQAAFSENTLAYYVGPTKGETKTKWLMHELVVPEAPGNGFHGRSAAAAGPRGHKLLNRFVVCRIYKSPLRKWKEMEEAAEEEEVPTSPQSSSGPAPECVGEEAAWAPSSSRQPPAKRTAVERPAASRHAGAPIQQVSQTTLFPGGRPTPPTRGNGGGSSVRMPPVGAGAAGRHGAGLPALVHWPPVYRSMQGPVQVQQPPSVYWHSNRAARTPNANGQAAPLQGPPVLRPRPPHRAAATAPSSQGPTMMRPPHLATGQPARLPSPWQQRRPPPPPLPPEMEEAYRNRVYARLIAEMKLQKAQEANAARAGQQQISQQAASTQPACFHGEGANCNRPVGAEAMALPVQFPSPHGAHPDSSRSNLAQPPQQQQSSPANPAAAENVSSKQSVPPGADEGCGKGDAATIEDNNIILQILTPWPL